MSYEEAKRAHDEQMTRVRAALAGDDPREAVITELRAQLANATAERDERSLVAEQLSMALHLRDTQLATVTVERDALRALVERYGADQWRRGNAGKEPQEFSEWQKEAQP